MFKITAIISLMLIATWSQAVSRRNKKDSRPTEDFDTGNMEDRSGGRFEYKISISYGSTLWAAGLSCDSCGSECASACGTRHFRSCCFNYLRKKRGPDALWTPNLQDAKENQQERFPIFAVKSIPDPWYTNLVSNSYRPYPYEDTADNHLQMIYDL
ncbi:unnamed protein product [Diatraea saccharalis]|uniref:Uncharacterized protein n=1 Tax=Diatraea saccharalis TaxID=40085 RepID=A0A9N9R561_9NEOP|nr:unnamed protein product [Diatraea saccharalis]